MESADDGIFKAIYLCCHTIRGRSQTKLKLTTLKEFFSTSEYGLVLIVVMAVAEVWQREKTCRAANGGHTAKPQRQKPSTLFDQSIRKLTTAMASQPEPTICRRWTFRLS
ncbi:hypothetical protein T06_7906 [Trichinella sp. T6]|nr:hypothetical protein T06_7906 [Trichinella sp. T6]